MNNQEQEIKRLKTHIAELEKEIQMIYDLEKSEEICTYIKKCDRARQLTELMALLGDNELKVSEADKKLCLYIQKNYKTPVINDLTEYFEKKSSIINENNENNDMVFSSADGIPLLEYSVISYGIRIDKYIESADMEEISIPDMINDIPVVEIGDTAFSHCYSLKYINLPKYLIRIGKEAFYCSNLKKIELPNGLMYIGKDAFYESHSLKSIKFSDSINYIADGAFYWCDSLEKIIFPKNLVEIGKYAFSLCESLRFIQFQNNLKYIRECAFQGCKKLNSVSLPGSLELIGESSFSSCNISSINFSSGIERISNLAFEGQPEGAINDPEWNYGNKFKYIDLPSGLRCLSIGAFVRTGLKGIRIPDSVEILWDENVRYFYEGLTIYCNSSSCIMRYAAKAGYEVKPYSDFDIDSQSEGNNDSFNTGTKAKLQEKVLTKAIPNDIDYVIVHWNEFINSVKEVLLKCLLERVKPSYLEGTAIVLVCEEAGTFVGIQKKINDISSYLLFFLGKNLEVIPMRFNEYNLRHNEIYGVSDNAISWKDGENQETTAEDLLATINFEIGF